MRRVVAAIGPVAAVLALVSQIALGAVFLPDDAARAQDSAFAAASMLCAGTPHDHPGGPTRHRPHAPGRALCPLGAALALPACMPVPWAVLPDPPRGATSGTRSLPPARGPPPLTARVGAPRAPPILA